MNYNHSIFTLLGGSIFLSMLVKAGRLLPDCRLAAPKIYRTVDTLFPARLTRSSFFLTEVESLRWVELTLGMNNLL